MGIELRESDPLMANYTLTVNGTKHTLDLPPDMPVLWVLRDVLGLTGSKYACGVGICGACTALLDDEPIRTCSFPVSEVKNGKITTIEGLSKDGTHPVQKAWMELDVPQCGYCQTGQIVTAAALLKKTPRPTAAQIDEAMKHSICRCGTYPRIRKAIHLAAQGGGK